VTGIIWIKAEGNMGNRALQYLAAAGIAMHAPDVKKSKYSSAGMGHVRAASGLSRSTTALL
jgi:hypothetical protein